MCQTNLWNNPQTRFERLDFNVFMLYQIINHQFLPLCYLDLWLTCQCWSGRLRPWTGLGGSCCHQCEGDVHPEAAAAEWWMPPGRAPCLSTLAPSGFGHLLISEGHDTHRSSGTGSRSTREGPGEITKFENSTIVSKLNCSLNNNVPIKLFFGVVLY